ncbi:MAG: HAMP domain-containing histidine kinase [Candidatus Omnitrophica bacterium]|nr:HAMP domain-containing histidine kinase [Candidatus Omnitrophota bacterium]
MKINSIKFKICVLYVGILGLILTAYQGLLYFNLYQTLYRNSDKQLVAKAQGFRQTLLLFAEPLIESKKAVVLGARRILGGNVRYPDEEKIKTLETIWQDKKNELGLNKDYINLLNEEGKSVAGSANMHSDLAKFLEGYAKKKPDKQALFNVVYKESLNLRIIVLPVDFGKLGRYTIEVGISTDPILYVLRERISKSAMSIPPIIAFAVLISYFFVWQILRPVKQIAKTANNISYGNLTARVNIANVDAEMKYLAKSFNDMISRLDESFTHIADFSSYVAHELRTPLTIIKGETEVALTTVKSFEECNEVMRSNLQEVDKMLKIIDHLFLLADINYRKNAFNFEPVDLCGFLSGLYDKTVLLAAQKNIKVKLDTHKDKIKVMANKVELGRLFFNLIDNAIKFTPEGGDIELSLKSEKKKAFIAVKDTGIGIKQDEIPKVFNKFYRSTQTEKNFKPGSGLGLSIAQSIARTHQGHIEIKSIPEQGATFTVVLNIL